MKFPHQNSECARYWYLSSDYSSDQYIAWYTGLNTRYALKYNFFCMLVLDLCGPFTIMTHALYGYIWWCLVLGFMVLALCVHITSPPPPPLTEVGLLPCANEPMAIFRAIWLLNFIRSFRFYWKYCSEIRNSAIDVTVCLRYLPDCTCIPINRVNMDQSVTAY